MSDDSYKIIFLDFNNIITEENVELKDGDDLKKEIKEKFEVSSWIIDNFIENHILVDIEKEENYIYHLTSFIYRIEKNKTKAYKFYLFRQIDEHINIEPNACFIIFDLEKKISTQLIDKLKGIFDNIIKYIKLYILGYYKSKNNIVTEIEGIEAFLIDDKEAIEPKYLVIELNKENQEEVGKINKHIEDMLKDIYNENNTMGGKRKDKGESMAQSGCILI